MRQDCTSRRLAYELLFEGNLAITRHAWSRTIAALSCATSNVATSLLFSPHSSCSGGHLVPPTQSHVASSRCRDRLPSAHAISPIVPAHRFSSSKFSVVRRLSQPSLAVPRRCWAASVPLAGISACSSKRDRQWQFCLPDPRHSWLTSLQSDNPSKTPMAAVVVAVSERRAGAGTCTRPVLVMAGLCMGSCDDKRCMHTLGCYVAAHANRGHGKHQGTGLQSLPLHPMLCVHPPTLLSDSGACMQLDRVTAHEMLLPESTASAPCSPPAAGHSMHHTPQPLPCPA